MLVDCGGCEVLGAGVGVGAGFSGVTVFFVCVTGAVLLTMFCATVVLATGTGAVVAGVGGAVIPNRTKNSTVDPPKMSPAFLRDCSLNSDGLMRPAMTQRNETRSRTRKRLLILFCDFSR